MKTIGPLHFEDLEPHRFEDLVRQLAYDFRSWRDIEAVGRRGLDEGIDIRATEVVPVEPTLEPALPDEEGDTLPPVAVRPWLFQCKRELSIGPAKLRKYVAETLDSQPTISYGFVLAAICDFTKKSRDAFRQEVAQRGVGEFYLWGKAELEDMLFRPQNDHLLFAYFGLSLQTRRRSATSHIRSNLALKRALVRHLGPIHQRHREQVLIRDPADTRYPQIEDLQQFMSAPPWRYWRFWGHEPVDHLAFVAHEHFAYFDPETGKWDALTDLDLSWLGNQQLFGFPDRWDRDDELFAAYEKRERRYRAYWSSQVPKQNREILVVLRKLPFSRILAIDELGDHYNEPPHLLVEYLDAGPFDLGTCNAIDLLDDVAVVDEEDRTSFFPTPIPDMPPGES